MTVTTALLMGAGSFQPASAVVPQQSARDVPGPVQSAVLAASDGAVDDYFGQAVAIVADGLVAVGAPQRASRTGAAYVYICWPRSTARYRAAT